MNDLDFYEFTETEQPCRICLKPVNLVLNVLRNLGEPLKVCVGCYLDEADRGE